MAVPIYDHVVAVLENRDHSQIVKDTSDAAHAKRLAAAAASTTTPAGGARKPVTGSVAGPLALGAADNPFSITASGTVTATGPGVDAIGGHADGEWAVVNDGTITSGGGMGVALAGSGTVTNGPSRGPAASIIGAAAAVRIGRGPSAVINSGAIAATNTGVSLQDGGRIVNNPKASLRGDQLGVFIAGGPGAVVNGGQITGSERIGVDLAQGGSIGNAAGASITGYIAGVFFAGGPAALTNAGRISAAGAAGVDIEGGGDVANGSRGFVEGNAFGIFVAGGAGTVNNQGTIAGKGKFGVDLSVGGSVLNAASASIAGAETGLGLYGGQGKVTNQGTISGGTAAVRFSNGGNLLVAGPAAVFQGSVVGGTTSGNTLELAGGNGALAAERDGAGVVTANGHSWPVSNFDVLKIDRGGNWALNAGLVAQTIVNNGTITVTGTVRIPTLRSSDGSGLLQLARGAELHVTSASGDRTQIRFSGDSRLVLDAPSSFGSGQGTPASRGPQLQGFGAGDAVVLTRFSPSKVVLKPAPGMLTISNGEQSVTLAFQSSKGSGEVFQAAADGADGTAITRKRVP